MLMMTEQQLAILSVTIGFGIFCGVCGRIFDRAD